MMKQILVSLLLAVSLAFPRPSFAHAFGISYTLPLPLWMYLYGGGVALAISFVLIGYFFTQKNHSLVTKKWQLPSGFSTVLTHPTLIRILKFISIALFVLLIFSGLFGTKQYDKNINMTFFWVIFVIGFVYFCALFGNLWSVLNPLKLLSRGVVQLFFKRDKPPIIYPEKFGYLPAVVLFLIFIWIELYGQTSPYSLSLFLLFYFFITLHGTILFGEKIWFTYFEFFSVFFGAVSHASILTVEKKKVYFRVPFAGLLTLTITQITLLFFLITMLAATAFDGFRETLTWSRFVFSLPSVFYTPGVLEWLGILGTPLLFFVLYLLTMVLMKVLVKSAHSVKELALAFAPTLIPIIVAYHFAHYFTLLLAQGQYMLRLISDPFGWGWNLFQTAQMPMNAGIIGAAQVWNMQIYSILFGHIAAVFLSHIIAMQIYPTHKKAMLSQLPMLVLMVGYTILGLWLLAQPMTTG